MSTYFEAFTVREGLSPDKREKREFWTRIGVGFPNSSGGVVLSLHAMPVPVLDQYKIILLPPKRKAKR